MAPGAARAAQVRNPPDARQVARGVLRCVTMRTQRRLRVKHGVWKKLTSEQPQRGLGFLGRQHHDLEGVEELEKATLEGRTDLRAALGVEELRGEQKRHVKAACVRHQARPVASCACCHIACVR